MSFFRFLATGKCQIASIITKSWEFGYFYQIFSIYFMSLNDLAGVFGEAKITFGWNGEGIGGFLIGESCSTVYGTAFIHLI